MSTSVIISLAALGVAAAIFAFFKTPREQRYRGITRASLDDQLKSCQVDAEAVVIKGNMRGALIRVAPFILIGVVLAGFSQWIKGASNPECVRLLGFNAAYISLLLACYGIPFAFVAASSWFVGTGIKTIRTGYFPPLDSVVFRDTIAKKGAASTWRGVALMVVPVLAVVVVYLGNSAYTSVTGGKTAHEIVEKLEAKCH